VELALRPTIRASKRRHADPRITRQGNALRGEQDRLRGQWLLVCRARPDLRLGGLYTEAIIVGRRARTAAVDDVFAALRKRPQRKISTRIALPMHQEHARAGAAEHAAQLRGADVPADAAPPLKSPRKPFCATYRGPAP
jgi:hypothetical protein